MTRKQDLYSSQLRAASLMAILAVGAFLIGSSVASAGECGNPCTVTSASFPNLQLVDSTAFAETWALRTVSDGAELQILNVSFDERPFRIEAGAGTNDNLLYLDFNERIGINTTVPVEELQINSVLPIIRLDDTSSGEGLADLRLSANVFGIAGESGFNVLAVDTRFGATTFFINQSGLLGIGTLSPTAKLHVDGDARIEGDIAIASSRTLKTGFESVSSTEILARIADLPVAAWRYLSEEETDRHIGPFAEDFQRLFGVGDGETISVIDAQGVAFAAIQGLAESNSILRRELAEKSGELAGMRLHNAELTARVEAIEDSLSQRGCLPDLGAGERQAD